MSQSKMWRVSMAVAIALFFAGGMAFANGQKESQTATTSSSMQGPVKVSMFAQFATDVIDPHTNWFTKYIEKNYNLKIDWVLVPPSANILDKQSLLLASGNYPDVFWAGNFSTSDTLKYAQQGVLQPMDQAMVQQVAPNVWKALQSNQQIHDIAFGPNGKMWGLPNNQNFCTHCYFASKYWIDTKLLEKYNLQMPRTTAQFEQVLKVFKQNGLIPLTGTVPTTAGGWHGYLVTFLMNSFIYNTDNQNATNYFDVNNGKVSFAAVQPQWKQGLQYLHRLYQEGLIDQQGFSQNLDGMQQEVAQGKVAVVPYGFAAGFLSGGTQNPTYKNWQTLKPLVGPSGAHYAAFYGNGNTHLGFVLTNKATKTQERALLKLINFMYTPEGTETWDFGPEGKYWTKAKPGQLGLNGKQALFNTDEQSFYSGSAQQNEGYDQTGPGYQSEQWRRGFVIANPVPSVDGLESALLYFTERDMVGNQPKEVYPAAAWIAPQDAQQYALYSTNIYNYVVQWTTQFIVGTKSIDSDWNSYVAGVKNLGLSDFLSMAQKAMLQPFNTSQFAQPDQSIVNYLGSLK